MMGYYLIRTAPAEYVCDKFEFWGMGEEEFILLDVFVKREEVCFGRGMVGLEKREVEMVLVNGNVENQAYAAH